MHEEQAIEAFAALAQSSRLAVFQLLVKQLPQGLPVGVISRRLDIVPSTLSGHLAVLRRARLLKAVRHHREIHYSADLATMRQLIRFMLKDCCEGQVENCAEILSLMPC